LRGRHARRSDGERCSSAQQELLHGMNPLLKDSPDVGEADVGSQLCST
jgi:hypothetical protein